MSTPQRIQLSRARGFRLPPNTVVVARPSMFGNHYRVADVHKLFAGLPNARKLAQQACVDAYRDWLDGSPAGDELKVLIRQKLRGKNLACWCAAGSPCHADVLLKIANR